MSSNIVRQFVSESELKSAIETCAKEPIHIPGAIQPQGFMIIVDQHNVIRRVSKNTFRLFDAGRNEMLDKPLSHFLSNETIDALSELTSHGALNPLRSLSIPLDISGEQQLFDAIIHASGDMRVIELEPSSIEKDTLASQDFYQELMSFSVKLQQISDSSELYNFVVDEVRNVTKFSRVKLYIFDHAWNGKIVAESKEDHMSSYLGLSFPHSDIPEQARALYAKNYLRLIGDVDYEPVPLIPNDLDDNNHPIDLSFSVLRSVSPVHIQYLKNMGVVSSMSISVMQNGKLWGMIVCHHHKAYHVPYKVRMLAELIGHSFSAFLSGLTQKEEAIEASNKKQCISELNNALNPEKTLIELLKNRYRVVLDSVGADGVIIHLDGRYFSFGMIPEISYAKQIIAWLEENHEDRVFASDSIMRDVPGILEGQPFASGVLAIPVSAKMTDYIIWFREEQARQVNWAGKPEKKVELGKSGLHLTPRASFDRWQENVRGFSTPWSEADIEMALEVGKILLTKRYEDILRKKTENFDSILQHSSAMIYIVNLQEQIVNINDAAVDALNLNHAPTFGTSIDDVFDAEFAALIREQHASVIKNQQPINFDHQLVVGEQTRHYISTNFPLYNVNGDVSAICAIATDITHLKETERSLLQSNKELEQMAYIASHDLQEPLRMIFSFTEILSMRYNDQLDDDANRYMGFIMDSAKRMKNLITDLLHYSRITSDDRPTPRIDTQEEYDRLISLINVMYEQKEAVIELLTPLQPMHMHPEHFTCVLQNLIGNAIKYCKEGEKPLVQISMRSEKSSWIFSVKDNGIGIAPEHHKKIFYVFQRLHNNDEYEGTGIGLALVQRIVHGYGGAIWIESDTGEGATFFFSVPKVPVNRKTIHDKEA